MSSLLKAVREQIGRARTARQVSDVGSALVSLGVGVLVGALLEDGMSGGDAVELIVAKARKFAAEAIAAQAMVTGRRFDA